LRAYLTVALFLLLIFGGIFGYLYRQSAVRAGMASPPPADHSRGDNGTNRDMAVTAGRGGHDPGDPGSGIERGNQR